MATAEPWASPSPERRDRICWVNGVPYDASTSDLLRSSDLLPNVGVESPLFFPEGNGEVTRLHQPSTAQCPPQKVKASPQVKPRCLGSNLMPRDNLREGAIPELYRQGPSLPLTHVDNFASAEYIQALKQNPYAAGIFTEPTKFEDNRYKIHLLQNRRRCPDNVKRQELAASTTRYVDSAHPAVHDRGTLKDNGNLVTVSVATSPERTKNAQDIQPPQFIDTEQVRSKRKPANDLESFLQSRARKCEQILRKNNRGERHATNHWDGLASLVAKSIQSHTARMQSGRGDAQDAEDMITLLKEWDDEFGRQVVMQKQMMYRSLLETVRSQVHSRAENTEQRRDI